MRVVSLDDSLGFLELNVSLWFLLQSLVTESNFFCTGEFGHATFHKLRNTDEVILSSMSKKPTEERL